MANYKSIVEFQGKRYQVIERYGVDRLSGRRYWEKIIRLKIVTIGGRVEDMVIVDEDDVKVVEKTYDN